MSSITTTGCNGIVILMLSLMPPIALSAQEVDPITEGESATLFDITDKQIASARLFYRIEGSRQFLQAPLSSLGSRWFVTFNGSQLTPPGIEYYVQLNFKNGTTRTEPETHPKYNPFRLVVNKKQSVSVQLASGNVQPGEDIQFTVLGYVDAQTRIYMGDLDVSDLVQRDNHEWRLQNDNNLFSGNQKLQLISADGQTLASQSVNFSDPGARLLKDRQLVLRGNASLNVGGQTDSSTNNDDALVLSGNLHVETEYNEGDFKSHFSGINVNFQHNATEEIHLSSGFLLSNTYRNHSLEVGDVSVSGTPLVLSGFSRRGMVASTESERFSGSVFNVRTSTVDGWESGISFDDRQTYGLTIEQKMDDKGVTNIQLAVVSGELQQPVTSNVGSANTNEQSGNSAGIQITTELAGTTLSAEVAGSSFDDNTSDSIDAQNDKAYELSLSRNILGLASSLGYHHYGANYATIANPNFSNDREGVNLSLGSGWQFLIWSTSFSTTRDNIESDSSRAKVTSNNTGLNLGFVFENWPSIDLGFNFSNQKSSDEPVASQGIDNKGRDISLGLSDSFDAYQVSWTSSVGELEDQLLVGSTSNTENHALSLGFNADLANWSLNLSQNKSKSDVELTSDLMNLSASFPLFTDSITLNSQFSIQDNYASDNSQKNSISGGSARISWTMGDMFNDISSTLAQTQFGLSWRYSKTSDELDSNQDSSDSVVMLELSFGAPVNFEYDWQF